MKYSALILGALIAAMPASAQMYGSVDEAMCKARQVLNEQYEPENKPPFDLNLTADKVAATQGYQCSGPGAGFSYADCEVGCRKEYLGWNGSDHEYCACLHGVRRGVSATEKYRAEMLAQRAKMEAQWAAEEQARREAEEQQ